MSVWRALLSRFVSGFAPSYTDFYDLAYDIQHPAGDVAHQGYNITDVGQLNFYAGGGIGQDSWTALTFSNSWVDYASGYPVSGSRADKQGRLWLRGMVKSGTYTDNTVLFTLPTAHRPTTSRMLLTTFYTGAGAWTNPCILIVGSNGQVKILGATGNSWVNIEGLSFDLS